MEQSALLQRGGHVSLEPNPALLEHAQKRAESVQNRIADQITTFAGSMWFVYIHIIWFSCWIGLGVERSVGCQNAVHSAGSQDLQAKQSADAQQG